MDNEFFFSIMIPVYNMERYLDNCIMSAIKQDGDDFEVILVDDGSTDSSSQICDYYSSCYSNIKVIHQKNAGLLLARRAALQIAKGKYFVFLDADDYLETNYLKILRNILKENMYDLILISYNIVDEIGNKIVTPKSIYDNGRIFNAKECRELIVDLIHDKIPYMWLKVINSKFVDCKADYSTFGNIKDGEDVLQSLYILSHINNAIYVDEHIYNYRYLATSMSKTIDKNCLMDFFIVRNEMEPYIITMSEENKKRFYSRIFYTTHRLFWHIHRTKITYKEYKDIWTWVSNEGLYKRSIEYLQGMSRTALSICFQPFFYPLIKVAAKIYFRNR